MATCEIHLQLLLGKRVLDSTGKPIGHIEEVRAHKVKNGLFKNI
jgi:sporulation protein YlmC with PRC-barrel domain